VMPEDRPHDAQQGKGAAHRPRRRRLNSPHTPKNGARPPSSHAFQQPARGTGKHVYVVVKILAKPVFVLASGAIPPRHSGLNGADTPPPPVENVRMGRLSHVRTRSAPAVQFLRATFPIQRRNPRDMAIQGLAAKRGVGGPIAWSITRPIEAAERALLDTAAGPDFEQKACISERLAHPWPR
jgi:hypothetical protein